MRERAILAQCTASPAIYRPPRGALGPWFFVASADRFAPVPQRGARCLADSPANAALAFIGPIFAQSGLVPEALVKDQVVWALHLPRAETLFGEPGPPSWPAGPEPVPLADVVASLPGLRVLPVPTRLSELTVLDEPASHHPAPDD